MIAKLLENRTTILILKLLSEKPLLLSQILESLDKIDPRSIIAILGELQRFKLLNMINTHTYESNHSNIKSADLLSEIRIENELGTLGIPLGEYASIWEKLTKNPQKEKISEFDRFYFSLPSYILEKIVDCKIDEIKQKILGSQL